MFAFSVSAGEPATQQAKGGRGAICETCEPDDGGGAGGTGGTGGGTTSSPLKIAYAAITPQTHTIEMRLSNGLQIVVDEPLNKIWIAAPGRTQEEFALSSILLQWASNDQVRADAMRAKRHAAISDPLRNAALAPVLTSSASGLIATQGGHHGRGMQGMVMDGTSSSYNCYYDLWCRTSQVSDWSGGGWGPYGFGYMDTGTGGGYGTPDYNYWNRWRQDHCDDASDAARGVALSVGGMLVTCPFAETGVGAAACAISGLNLLNEMDNYFDNRTICNSTYPGSGNW